MDRYYFMAMAIRRDGEAASQTLEQTSTQCPHNHDELKASVMFITLSMPLDTNMETQDESDLLKLLRRVLRDSVYEISDFEDVDHATTRLVAQALNLGLIRDDSTGWDNGARYVLTNDGRRALGLQIDWWMPEDLRGKLSAAAKTACRAQGDGARRHPSAILTTARMPVGRPLRAFLQCTPLLCLIAVVCGIILVTMVGVRMISH